MALEKLIANAKVATANEMIELANSVLQIVKKEKKSSILQLDCEEVIVVGDLHGDLESLSFILKDSNFASSKSSIIFLGDYGDRGVNSAEIYYVILSLKKEFPNRVILLRGNHEFLPGLEVWPHNLPLQLVARFGKDGEKIYQLLKELWNYFYLAAVVPNKYLFLHGGLPVKLKFLDEIEKYAEEILWSDPGKSFSYTASPRGAGKIFGARITKKVLNNLGIKTLIRSHQPPSAGVAVSHNGKILTISSTKVYGGKAAYLKIDLKDRAKNANELAKMARVF